jgi:Skp family chaperone for outer membrane proteins
MSRAFALTLLGLLAPWLLAPVARAAPPAAPSAAAGEVEIKGQVLYDGRGGAPARPAVADILKVYAHNPAYMHMRSRGWRETDPQGAPLFAHAKAAANKALAEAAQAAGVNVITVPGGVSGADAPPQDLTQQVIDRLPIYHVHGEVLSGRATGAQRIAEVDTAAVLAAIPAWEEAQTLGESDARFHLLRRRYLDELNRVVNVVARQGGYDTIVERGGTTSRLGPVPDLTRSAIAAVDR